MVEVNKRNKPIIQSRSLDNSILILGKAETNFKRNQIISINNIDLCREYYGDSELTNAFIECFNLDATNIYLCNCFLDSDYIDIIATISKYRFDFICPLFNFEDKYRIDLSRCFYLVELYSMYLNSQIIVTSKYADLFEDIEHYIDYVNSNYTDVMNGLTRPLLQGENLCYVTNNLKNYRYANVVLASILSTCNLRYYPTVKDIGDVVYDLLNSDFYNRSICYFAYNYITKTSVEHLFNFMTSNIPEKFIPIHLIIQKIRKALNFEDFLGKLFNRYTEIQLNEYIEKTMSDFVGNLIQNYELIEYHFNKSDKEMFVLDGYITIDILPYNSTENIKVTIEVK